ncbi:MAG: hypothetical protein H9W81_13655 [Enterococcus sp.]|nr:hypothetical protein [Enterococcus sp.]
MCRRKDIRAQRCPCDDPIPRRQRQNLAYAVATKGERDAREIERREAKATSVKDMVSDLPQAEAIVEAIASSPEVSREMASRLRGERENAESTEAWLLNGRDNTPENLAQGIQERQQEILAMGSVIASRADVLHGLNLDEEHAKWQERLDASEKELAALRKTQEEKLNEYLEVRKGLMAKYDALPYDLKGNMNEEDEATFNTLNTAYRNAEKTYEEQRKKTEDILRGNDPETLEVSDKIAAANQQAIRETRSFGAKAPTWTTSLGRNHTGPLGEVIQRTFPDDWVKSSDEKGELNLKRKIGRAHYRPVHDGAHPYTYSTKNKPDPQDSRFDGWREDVDENGKGTGTWRGPLRDWMDEKNTRNFTKFNGDTPKGTGWVRGKVPTASGGYVTGWVRDNPKDAKTIAAFSGNSADITVDTSENERDKKASFQHEFSHRVQDSRPHIRTMELAYIASRTTDANGVRDRLKAYNGTSVSERRVTAKDEVVREDNWVTPYMGREYADSEMTELLSLGTESVFSGSYGGLVGVGHAKKDPETRNWILGAYATL